MNVISAMKGISAILLIIFMHLQTITLVQGREICGTIGRLQYYCESDKYCCGIRNGVYQCCAYYSIFSQWYLWVGIVIAVISVIGALVGFCCRYQMAKRLQRQNQPTAVATATNQPHVATVTSSAYFAPPPSYSTTQEPTAQINTNQTTLSYPPQQYTNQTTKGYSLQQYTVS